VSKWDQVHRILDREVQREVKKVLGRIKAVVGGKGNGNGTTRVMAKRRKAVTYNTTRAKAPSKQRQLHGRYLGLIRTLPKAEKARLSALYKEDGVRKAIAEARKVHAEA